MTFAEEVEVFGSSLNSEEIEVFDGKSKTEGASYDYAQKVLNSLPTWFHKGEEMTKQLVLDTGCSCITTGDKGDFLEGSIVPLENPFPMDGVAGKIHATHKGTCIYHVKDDSGELLELRASGFYAPGLQVRLFSPQDYFQQQHEQGFSDFNM